jgi:hypothetical protein
MRQAIEELITATIALVRIAFVFACVFACVTVAGLTAYGFVAFFIRQAIR